MHVVRYTFFSKMGGNKIPLPPADWFMSYFKSIINLYSHLKINPNSNEKQQFMTDLGLVLNSHHLSLTSF